MVIQNMVPTLLRLYVDVEFTDQHNQVGVLRISSSVMQGNSTPSCA